MFVGAISGTTASFSGDVSVGGVLTYDDVTNIDSIGVVTAVGVHVTGVGASVGISRLSSNWCRFCIFRVGGSSIQF